MPSFLCSGSKGDLVYSLAAVKALGGGAFYVKPNVHRMRTRGQEVMRITAEDAERFLPLLRSQPYITEAHVWDGQKVDIDLDRFRQTGWRLGRGFIPRHFALAFDCDLDLVNPWLTVNADQTYSGNILFNRTQRYNNPRLKFTFLKKYPTVFIGLESENKLGLPLCQPSDFLQLAAYIAGCRAFIGGQSLCMSLAIAMGKVPRWLEVCQEAPDVIQVHRGAFDVWNQSIFEAQIEREMKKDTETIGVPFGKETQLSTEG